MAWVERGGWVEQLVGGLALVGLYMFMWFGWTEWRPAADQVERWASFKEASVKLDRIEAKGGKYPEWAGSGWVDGVGVEFSSHDLGDALGKADRVGGWDAREEAAKKASGMELRVRWNPEAIWRLAPMEADKAWVDARREHAMGASLIALAIAGGCMAWLAWRGRGIGQKHPKPQSKAKVAKRAGKGSARRR